MARKLILSAFIVLITVVGLASIALAQETNEQDPKQNWCYPGGPWGDGRCNATDPDLNNWYWTCGYWRAAVFNGRFGDWQAPAMCAATLREIRIEYSLADLPSPTPETPAPGETPTPATPVPGRDVPVASAGITVNWCTYEPWNDITIISFTVTGYTSATSSIHDVTKLRLTTSNGISHDRWLGGTINGSDLELLIFFPPATDTLSDLNIKFYDGGDFYLLDINVGTVNCDLAGGGPNP